ncbi:PAS domain-containing sensor histidine kinase [Roseimarinus sediminis]|uniref:PAS domain-containing sensor histidine kinase n=1 Tax=Roseimarinus sediminis TaxID=1610899 RepID=UPI003D1FA5B7
MGENQNGLHYDSAFKTLFDIATDGIFIEDNRGNIINCNRAGEKMFGYEPGELTGVNIRQLVPPEFAASIPDIIPEEAVTGDQYLERVNMRKDGSLFPTEICTKYAVIDGQKCLIAFIHDISEQKRIQQELEKAKKVMEQQMHLKEKFFSIISHDLKSPMEAILGFSDLLDEEKDLLPLKLQHYVSTLRTAAYSSSDLLENLLQWTLCLNGDLKPHYEEFELGSACTEELMLLQEKAAKKEIKLSFSIPKGISMLSDKNMLRFVVRNLLNNAIKFTQHSGRVDLIITEQNKQLKFEIQDTGIGLNENDIQRILAQRDFYSTPGTGNEKGTGLGLKVCNEFLNLLNSRLKIESTAGKGSNFSFELAM